MKLMIGTARRTGRKARPGALRSGTIRAIGRYFAAMLSSLILCIGYLLIAFDAEKRALHDMICDTRVIKTRE